MFALIFLVENSFYYESATELSSDFKTGPLVNIKWKIPAQTQPKKKKLCRLIFIVDSSMSR